MGELPPFVNDASSNQAICCAGAPDVRSLIEHFAIQSPLTIADLPGARLITSRRRVEIFFVNNFPVVKAAILEIEDDLPLSTFSLRPEGLLAAPDCVAA